MSRTGTWVAMLAIAPLAAACGKKSSTPAQIQTTTVTRRDIVVTAQATGTVEPVDTVAVKSQASGLIIAMPVEVGTQMKPGDLIAQIDTRNLVNDYQRSKAAQAAAQATLDVDVASLKRANDLYAQKVITATEHEAAVVAEANARSALTSTQTALKTAQQNLEYATVRAEVAGTVISKTASVGSVVSSAVSTFGGGSTIITIANLQRVRMRALVNETDIGNVHTGMPVTVTIDAFPNRQFPGQVEKVEPQAVIQQSVTMFPVLISLQNLDQALLPGMNGEVSIVTQQSRGVLAVPNDAVRSVKDLAAAATALGINPDSVRSMMGSSRRGGRGGGAGSSTSASASGASASGASASGASASGSGASGASSPTIVVTDSACKRVTAALTKSGGQARLDSLRAQMRAGTADPAAMRTSIQAIYQAAHVNADTARACARLARGGAGGGTGGAGTGGGGGTGGPQVVFVKQGTGWVPKAVRLGVSDYDYSEVLSGLKEGDEVALLGAVVLQAQRDQASARARSITGAGLPGSGSAPPPAAGGGAAGGARGGGGGGRPR